MDTREKVANVLDELGLETSGTISSVELVLSRVSMGRDVVSAHSQEVIVLCAVVVRAKDSPGVSEVGSEVLLPVVEVETSTETGAGADCVSDAGFVPGDHVECSTASVLVHAIMAGLAGWGIFRVSKPSGSVAGLVASVLGELSVVLSSCIAWDKERRVELGTWG